jgi:hypothetical protein
MAISNCTNSISLVAVRNFCKIMNGRRIDVFDDDGIHSDETILATIAAVTPYLIPVGLVYLFRRG